jgi:hypothetical protein
MNPDPDLIRINTQLARARSDLRGYIKIGASSPDQAAELKHIDADLTRVINAIGQRLEPPATCRGTRGMPCNGNLNGPTCAAGAVPSLACEALRS